VVHVSGWVSEAWISSGGPPEKPKFLRVCDRLSSACVRFRIETHRLGTFCPRDTSPRGRIVQGKRSGTHRHGIFRNNCRRASKNLDLYSLKQFSISPNTVRPSNLYCRKYRISSDNISRGIISGLQLLLSFFIEQSVLFGNLCC
jgi:hypothetical protein